MNATDQAWNDVACWGLLLESFSANGATVPSGAYLPKGNLRVVSLIQVHFPLPSSRSRVNRPRLGDYQIKRNPYYGSILGPQLRQLGIRIIL